MITEWTNLNNMILLRSFFFVLDEQPASTLTVVCCSSVHWIKM